MNVSIVGEDQLVHPLYKYIHWYEEFLVPNLKLIWGKAVLASCTWLPPKQICLLACTTSLPCISEKNRQKLEVWNSLRESSDLECCCTMLFCKYSESSCSWVIWHEISAWIQCVEPPTFESLVMTWLRSTGDGGLLCVSCHLSNHTPAKLQGVFVLHSGA